MPSSKDKKKKKEKNLRSTQDPQLSLESEPLLTPASSTNNKTQTYQQGSDRSTLISPSYSPAGSRSVERPTIRNYQDYRTPHADLRSFFAFGAGDASLRPNIGLTNSYDDALFGMALHEILENLRLANIISAVSSIVLLLVSWIIRLVGRVDQLVLSVYLAALSLVLLLTELMNLYSIQSMDGWLKKNFGLLRHPVGKAVYILVLSSICFGVGEIPEWIVGIVYLLSSILLIYTWCVYPEFRALFDEEHTVDHDDGASIDVPPSAQWSFYSTSPFAKTSRSNGNQEQTALLGAQTQADR